VNAGRVVPVSLSVLVVEPYPDAADSLAELLQLAGHRVAVAHTGAEALAAAPTDVVLMEVRLPDMDGWELVKWFFAPVPPATRKPLVVVITTGSSEADHQQSARAGLDWYFVKPADPALVLDVLAQFAAPTTC
jgi:CheY-like chemotaxis protein